MIVLPGIADMEGLCDVTPPPGVELVKCMPCVWSLDATVVCGNTMCDDIPPCG